MDPITLAMSALTPAGSCVAHKCADASVEAAWGRITAAFREWRGKDATSQAVEEVTSQRTVDPAVLTEAETIFELSSALRRARTVQTVLRGARILWIDDHPEHNSWERALFKAFGADVTNVETSRSALASLGREDFDVVLSDIDREGADEGLRALPGIRKAALATPVIFYVGTKSEGVPVGAFGITNDPNELLHLVFDALERTRL